MTKYYIQKNNNKVKKILIVTQKENTHFSFLYNTGIEDMDLINFVEIEWIEFVDILKELNLGIRPDQNLTCGLRTPTHLSYFSDKESDHI